jgi:membrane protein required for colicin V production
MVQFGFVDLIIIGILGLSVVTGLFRGFVKELIALSVWVCAIWIGYIYCNDVSILLKPYISSEPLRLIAGFILILLLMVIFGAILNIMLGFILKASGLSGMDRILGMVFGLIRGIFIVSLLISAAKLTAILPAEEQINQSFLYTKFTPITNWICSFYPKFIEKIKSIEGGIDDNATVVQS